MAEPRRRTEIYPLMSRRVWGMQEGSPKVIRTCYKLYQAEFHARMRHKNEEWAAVAEDLKLLTDKTFPEL